MQRQPDLTKSGLLLRDKVAVIFGAGGSIGAAVAKEFAAEGAEVFLAGRTMPNVEDTAKEVTTSGGCAHATVVDALDDVAVNAYIDGIVKEAGSIDIVFNAVGPLAKDYGNGKSALDLTTEQFMLPVNTVLRAQFISARAAARHMVSQRSGVIVFLTGGPAGAHIEGATAIGAAFGAIEALTRNLALDVSPQGVRVVCVRSSAMTDSRTIQESMEVMGAMMNVTRDQVLARIAGLTMLKTTASVSDTAKAVAFVASDNARMMTSNVINSTGGAVED
jgi:3-oxoacyl-[acyl-carrier protein] reductase